MGYCVDLNLSGKTALVVGAGAVAARKIRGLLGQNARIRVVAREISHEVEELAKSNAIEVSVRDFHIADLDEAFIVHAATSNRAVNQEIAHSAVSRGLLVCCAAGGDEGNFLTPSAFTRGELTISVATNRASPTLAIVLRERLQGQFGAEYAHWTRLFGRLRSSIQDLKLPDQRKAFVSRVLDDPDVSDRILAGDLDAAETAARRCI